MWDNNEAGVFKREVFGEGHKMNICPRDRGYRGCRKG